MPHGGSWESRSRWSRVSVCQAKPTHSSAPYADGIETLLLRRYAKKRLGRLQVVPDLVGVFRERLREQFLALGPLAGADVPGAYLGATGIVLGIACERPLKKAFGLGILAPFGIDRTDALQVVVLGFVGQDAVDDLLGPGLVAGQVVH